VVRGRPRDRRLSRRAACVLFPNPLCGTVPSRRPTPAPPSLQLTYRGPPAGGPCNGLTASPVHTRRSGDRRTSNEVGRSLCLRKRAMGLETEPLAFAGDRSGQPMFVCQRARAASAPVPRPIRCTRQRLTNRSLGRRRFQRVSQHGTANRMAPSFVSAGRLPRSPETDHFDFFFRWAGHTFCPRCRVWVLSRSAMGIRPRIWTLPPRRLAKAA